MKDIASTYKLATSGYGFLLVFQIRKLLDIQAIVTFLSPSPSYLKKDRKAHMVKQKGNKSRLCIFFPLKAISEVSK